MHKMTRRDFIKAISPLLAVGGLALVTTPIVAYFYPPNLEEVPSEPVMVGPQEGLPEGESKTVPYGRYPALVINTTQGLRAYTAVCTHFACIVKWDPTSKQIKCPCHDGFFDPYDGHVISGPPPTPLPALKVEIVDGQIYVGGEG